MPDFKIESCNREPAIAVDTASQKGLFTIPFVGETKEYGRTHNLDYSVPRFVGDNHYYICTRYRDKHKKEIWVTQMNPTILKTEGMVYVEETQHGVEGTYLVPRHPRILAAWTNAAGIRPEQRELIGMSALQFQQAQQAANGLFICDYGLRVDNYPEYQNGTDEERKEIIDSYIKALKEQYDAELKENEDTQKYIKASEFLAEKLETANAKEGVLPVDLQDKLNKEADQAE